MAPLVLVVAACGGSFAGQELHGELRDFGAQFSFPSAPTDPARCLVLPAGAARFDGEIVEEVQRGGPELLNDWRIDPQCVPVLVSVSLDGPEHDGELALGDDGDDGDVVRYVGRNLIAERAIDLVDGAVVTGGGALRFRVHPATDILSGASAMLTETSHPLEATTGEDGELTVSFGADLPLGRHTLALVVDITVPTVACEGFSSCDDVGGQVLEELSVTIR